MNIARGRDVHGSVAALRLAALLVRGAVASLGLLLVRSPALRLASLWFVRFAHLWHLRWVGFLASPVGVGHFVESGSFFGGRMNAGSGL